MAQEKTLKDASPQHPMHEVEEALVELAARVAALPFDSNYERVRAAEFVDQCRNHLQTAGLEV